MTKKELTSLYYLNREIENDQKRLMELEDVITGVSQYITGMPRGSGGVDKISRYTAQIMDLKEMISLNIQKCFLELNRLNRYIQSVDDSFIRQILTFRYINGLKWEEVADHIGGNNTGDSVRKAHDRFLVK